MGAAVKDACWQCANDHHTSCVRMGCPCCDPPRPRDATKTAALADSSKATRRPRDRGPSLDAVPQATRRHKTAANPAGPAPQDSTNPWHYRLAGKTPDPDATCQAVLTLLTKLAN